MPQGDIEVGKIDFSHFGDGKGFFETIDSDEDLDEFIEIFKEWVEHYLGCVTEFHQRYGR